MRVRAAKEHIRQFSDIIDPAHCSDGISPVMRADDQRLGFIITDTPDAEISRHLYYIFFKLRPEVRALYIVDRPVKAFLCIIYRHAGASCSKMRMIVCPVKQVKEHILTQCGTKKTTHAASLKIERKIAHRLQHANLNIEKRKL